MLVCILMQRNKKKEKKFKSLTPFNPFCILLQATLGQLQLCSVNCGQVPFHTSLHLGYS